MPCMMGTSCKAKSTTTRLRFRHVDIGKGKIAANEDQSPATKKCHTPSGEMPTRKKI